MKKILLTSIFCMIAAQAEEKGNSLSSLGYKSAFEYILKKNLRNIKDNSFAVVFQRDKVFFYSAQNCSTNFIEIDSAGYSDENFYEKDELIARYASYIDFSFKDKHKIPFNELSEYYLCFIDDGNRTIFMYTGGENSRGGGPLYVIDSKSNKLLEVHYMQ